MQLEKSQCTVLLSKNRKLTVIMDPIAGTKRKQSASAHTQSTPKPKRRKLDTNDESKVIPPSTNNQEIDDSITKAIQKDIKHYTKYITSNKSSYDPGKNWYLFDVKDMKHYETYENIGTPAS